MPRSGALDHSMPTIPVQFDISCLRNVQGKRKFQQKHVPIRSDVQYRESIGALVLDPSKLPGVVVDIWVELSLELRSSFQQECSSFGYTKRLQMGSAKLEAGIYRARQVRFLLQRLVDDLFHVSTVQSSPVLTQLVLT